MTINVSPTEQDYFDDYMRAGIPPEAARRFAREDALGERRVPNRTNGEDRRCAECGEAIRLDTASPEAGVLAGASVWVHERFYPFGMEPHEPSPVSTEPESR